MISLVRSQVAVGVFMLVVGTACPAAAEWRRVESPNFVVVGDVPARTLQDVALEFEAFRETVSRTMTERPTSSPVPTVIVVFPNEKAFAPFKPLPHGKPASNSGMFVARPDVNYAAVVAGGKADAMRPLFHEYAHVVIANTMRNVPLWLSEGFAEYFSTFELGKNGRDGVHGQSLSHHLRRIQNTPLLKMEELLAVDRNSPLYSERERRSTFYAQSWAITHRMLRGDPPRTKELASYMERVSAGMTPIAAWQQIFGAIDIGRELEQYARRQTLATGTHTLSEKSTKLEADTPLAAADAEAFLAEYLLQMGRYDEAATRLTDAFKLDPASVRLKVLAAELDVARGEHKKANDQLLAIGPAPDWLVAYSAATSIAEVVARRPEPADADQIEKARSLFEVVRKQRGDMANSIARMATLEVKSAEGPSRDTRTAIERARLMAAGREDYVFIHAQVLAGLSEFGSARTILGPLMAPPYPQDVRENARSLIGYILRLESENQAKSRAAEQAGDPLPPGAAAEPSPSDAAPSTNQSGFLFRELREGEQRLQGTLERIECRAKGTAIFHVRTPEGITKVGGRMSAVDFVTYRDDISTKIGCGALKSPPAISLTWRVDANNPNERVAVAIEFLPK
jgi:hypothetical protein